jgi:hypothetical protein
MGQGVEVSERYNRGTDGTPRGDPLLQKYIVWTPMFRLADPGIDVALLFRHTPTRLCLR